MADPTIVLASLSDDKLKESINSLVKHVNDKMEEMVESTNSAVKRMEDKLKSLGGLKIDSGSSNDGGTGRRTQQHEKLTKAVNDASEAVSKETQKLQDLQQSLSGASDREQNFISQKERAANTIAQENELLGKQQSELERLKLQKQSLLKTEGVSTKPNDETSKRIERLNQQLEEAKTRLQGLKSLSVISIDSGTRRDFTEGIIAEAKRLKSTLDMSKMSLEEMLKLPSTGNEKLDKHIESVRRLMGAWNSEPIKLAEERIISIKREINSLTSKKGAERTDTNNSQRIAQIDAQVAAKEKEIAETKGRIATATKEQSEAEKNASQAAKEKANIQSQVANQEKQVAEAKKQLTTATQQQAEVEKQSVQNVVQQTAARDKQIKKNQETAISFDQMAKAQQVAIRSASPSGIRNADTLQTMNIQLDLLRERLREARQQYSSFVALAAHATTTGDKGLFQYATDGVHRYEQEIRNLIPQIRTLQSGIQQMGDVIAPQGHTIQNYVNSLQKANPELAALNSEFKNNQSVLQQQNTEQQKTISHTEEESRKLQTLQDRLQQLKNERKELSKAMQDAGWDRFGTKIQLGAYPDDTNLKNKLIDAENRYTTAKQKIAQVDKEIASIESELSGVRSKFTSSTQQATQSAQHYTEEIRKQAAAISSKKDATKAFEQISLMPSVTMDEIKAKGQALVELVRKVKDTPLMSQSNVKLAEKMIGSLANQYRALKEEKEKVANTATTNASSENTTKRSLEQEKQDLERLKALQEERRQQIIQTGIAAQQQARTLRESIGKQMQSADYTNQVDKVKELQNALTEMKNAYKQPIDSSLKKSLEEDIAITQKALDIAKRYNMTVAGLGGIGVGGKAPTDTLAAYSAEAQRLANIYRNLSTEERRASAGEGLKRKYQELSHKASEVRKELERPVNIKDAMSGGEKTIDDLVYKIQRLESYKRGLNFQTQSGEIRDVDNKIKSLNEDLNKYLGTAQKTQRENTALGRSWNYMKNRLAFYFTVGASTQFVKNLIEVRSQYEMNERALGILIDSAERGTQIFNELSQMALVSPYTLIELSTAAKQLTAYDVAAKDVVDTTRRLADMASAVGVPVERLTYALGQIKAYGYLNSRDARMFANAGIPLVKELADHYTTLEGRLVSTADVYDRIKKKAIDYNDVMQVMNEMTDEGGKFYDFQAKMADTLKVQLANLTLAWNNMLNDLGNSQQGLLTSGIGALKELFLHWKDLDRILTNLAVTIGTAKAAQLLLNMSFGKGTLAAIKNISAIEGNTAAMYENALSKSNLSKAEARWLISTNRSNVALREAMVNMKLLTAEEAKAAASTTVLGVRMGWLGRVMKTNFFGLASVVRGAAVGMEMLGKAMLSIVTNPVFLAITAAMALVDALLYYNQIAEKTAEMNKAIADNAKEASEAIGDYLKDSVNIGNRAKAAQGVLSVSEGQKAWESIREQIELSSDAASVFISKLLEEEDINKRVKEGFDVAESIREATNAMAGLNAEALKVSQDSWLWGAFGEGLAEDLEDYIEAVQRGRKNGDNIGSRYFAADKRKEAKDELTAFANDAEEIIRDRLGAGVNDAVQLKEAIERIKKEVIAANPQIKGEVKKWFDVEVDRMMAERFGGVYNELSSIQSQFIEHIKRDSGAALRRLSDDILDTSKELDDDVLGAISKAWDKLKNELPAESQDLISKLQKQMDENPLTLRVLLLQAGEQQIRDAIQKDYEQHFYDANIGEKPKRPKDVGNLWSDYKGDYEKYAAAQEQHEKEMVVYNQKNAEWEAKRAEYVAKYGDFNKKNDETRAKWAKRVNDEIKAADAEEKSAKHARESLEAELSLEERKTDARYLSAVKEEQEAKNRKAAAQEAWNYEKLYQEEKGKGRKGSKKDPLLDALKQEISLVEKLQSDYDKLSKSGASQEEALETIRGAYGKTIRLLNAQLGKYGLPQLDISQQITGKDPHKALEHFKQTLDTLVSKGLLTLERSKEIEAVIDKFTLSAKTYDLDMITKGLNNELGKLKDEYELAVELDADPELGNAFASMMGINVESLPHTVKEYADEYSKYLNKYLKGKNSSLQFTGDELRGLTRDDINALQSQVDAGTFNQEWFDVIKKAYEDISGKRKKDLEETEKWKNSLIEKYGNLQDKLTKIYKDSVQNQVNAVKTFGTEDQKSEIVRLQLRLEETDNPAELAEINTEIAKIVKDVTDKNPIALKLVTASDNQTKVDTSKAYWEDFKGSDLYTMTFEDMANNSTRAIQLIIDKLNNLKNDVKEDPASMKALIKSLEDAEKELNARDPFGGIARSLRDMSAASQETKTAQEALWRAEVDVEQAQQEVDNAEDGTPEEQASAQQKLADAVQRRAAAQVKLTQAENKGKKAQENLKSSLQGITGELGNVKSLFDTVSSLFRAGGDDETADAIDAISEGFSVMTTVIMGVVAAMVLLESSQPWLLAIAAALSVIVGLVKFLSGNDNEKIDEEIKESELAVKRLENAYKELQAAVEEAYGTMKYSAEQAAIANKKAQLAEMRRQLNLEQSRDSKDRDDDKIASIQGQIIDLQQEIEEATKNIINDMLGITSVGDAAEQMVSAMIDAFRSGEDYMKSFSDSFEDMIDNMIMKAIVSRIIGQRLESLWNEIDSKAEERGADAQAEINRLVKERQKQQDIVDSTRYFEIAHMTAEHTIEDLDKQIEEAKKRYEKAIEPTPEDVNGIRTTVEGWKNDVKSEFEAWMAAFGISYGDRSDKQLSALKQGIQGITEDTAGALEGITNGISQQCYLQSDLLTQIRDAVVGIDMDVQLGVFSQMLLQLQNNYIVMQSMQSMMENWTVPSGSGIRVELMS